MQRPTRSTASIARGETAAPSAPVRRTVKGVSPSSLIDALKNSTTHNDQIIQRRIGAPTEPDEVSKESRQVERTSCPEE